MSPTKSFFTISFLIATIFPISTHATTFQVKNNCSYTVWGAAVPGGGRKMNPGDTWAITAGPGETRARIWARTMCNITGSNALKCNTGDCGGLLECTTYGTPPNTLVEFALNAFNNKQDFFDISLVDGFNVPVSLTPISNGCTAKVSCSADLNSDCPAALRSPGGCNSACDVFKTDQYCCTSGSCEPTEYSRYFKSKCPEAYSNPQDDTTSTLVCASGTNYMVTFCP